MANFQNKLTPERREEILSAMEAANGVKKDAAKVLGCTTTTLLAHIRRDEILSAKYDPLYVKENVDPAVHRPVDRDAVLAVSVSKEEASLVGGWQEVGFDADDADYLSSLSKFTNGALDEVLAYTHGAMVHNAGSLALMIRDAQVKLSELMDNPESFNEYNSEGGIVYSGWKKIKDTNTSIVLMMKEMRASNDATHDTMITAAKIDEIKRVKAENNKVGFQKAGFLGGPPEVFGNAPNLTQHVTNNNGVKAVTEV